MALMRSRTYDALREAAEEIAAYENRLTRIETDIALIKAEIGEVRAAVSVHGCGGIFGSIRSVGLRCG